VPCERAFDILPVVKTIPMVMVGRRIGDDLGDLRVTIGHLVASISECANSALVKAIEDRVKLVAISHSGPGYLGRDLHC
jgi:hypothetical protein